MLRYQSAAMIQALPDDFVDNQWEVILPSLDLVDPLGSAEKSEGLLGTVLSSVGSFFSSYTPIVEEIVFGVTNFKTNSRRVRTMWCNVPEDIENYGDVTITFFVSSGMLTQYYLSAWRKLVYNADGEYYYPMSIYKKNIEVFLYGPGNIGTEATAVAHFTLQGCFPSTQERFRLSYKDDPQRLRITQTFKVDKVVYDMTTAKKAIAMELITSPTALVDKAVTKVTSLLGGGPSEYSTSDVYGYAGYNSSNSPATNATASSSTSNSSQYNSNGLLPNEYVDDQGLIHSTTGEY